MRRVVFGNGLGRVGVCRLSREGQGWRTGLGAGAGAGFSEGLWSPEPRAGPAWLPANGVLLTGLPVTWGVVRAAGGPIQQMRKWRPGRSGFLPDHNPSAPNQASCPGSSLSTLAAALHPGGQVEAQIILRQACLPWTRAVLVASCAYFTQTPAPGLCCWASCPSSAGTACSRPLEPPGTVIGLSTVWCLQTRGRSLLGKGVEPRPRSCTPLTTLSCSHAVWLPAHTLGGPRPLAWQS